MEIDSRRELFVDHFLIDRLVDAQLLLHEPRDEGQVLAFDRPWEGAFVGYCTVIKEKDRYRLYYRGNPRSGGDGSDVETTCYAESTDGIHWKKPRLKLFEIAGSKDNNIVLAHVAPYCHNFCPLLDTRPQTPKSERYKGLAGTSPESGLMAFVSADGLRWKKLQEKPVFYDQGWIFDSQNVAFWSDVERRYVLYYRKAVNDVRSIARATSEDFIHWSEPTQMSYSDTGTTIPSQHLYTNQTQPYFRAPHIYLATAARFMPGRRVLSDEQAKEIGVDPGYFGDVSDAVLMTSRGGSRYDRTFDGALIKPGLGLHNWVSRTNYPALNVVPTGLTEMSLYVQSDYGQPTAHLRRYSLRLDGFASLHAPLKGGEVITRPLRFSGKQMLLNFSTSAAGDVRVEIQDAGGKPLPGYTLADARELIGNEIERAYSWKDTDDVSSLAGKVVRLRFLLRDADLFSFQFR
ncbi:MAG: hypothetical protein IT427_07885 [Pirellulales bacterium]|nr:hypothetical protein [Pirellulales bacterium]